MSLKKVFAGVAAAAVAASAMTFAAFAEVGETEVVAEPVLVELANGGVMVNDGGVRVNLVHPWGGEENWDAFHIVDAADFAGTQAISVKFSVTGVTDPFNAWLIFATNTDDDASNIYYWGADNANGVTQTPVLVEADGEYVITIYTDVPVEITDNFFFALQTDITPDADDEALENVPQISIVAVARDAALTVDADVVPGESSGNVDEPTPENPDNVDTGVALTVVPAALAAAALVAAGVATKKRK
ncbi:MAG: hypothetical protein J1E39_08540 [Eubacterium sp.]|nr:hypothetical protein [Eubacterium sp.]